MIKDFQIEFVDIQQLGQTLGLAITDSDFNHCLKKIDIQQPLAGKEFWQTAEAQPGIYIVITGKVRLVDGNQELLITLDKGDSFGENTLFAEASFESYSARASLNVKLGRKKYSFSAHKLVKEVGHYLEVKNSDWRSPVFY